MQPINMQLLRGKSEFAEAVEVTGKMGLHHLMGLQCHYNVTLLKQFYATLVIKGYEARTLKWMSGDVYWEATVGVMDTGVPSTGCHGPLGPRSRGPQIEGTKGAPSLSSEIGRAHV